MDNQERRKYPRKPFADHVLLQIGTEHGDVFERALISDISLDGICFTNLKTLGGFEAMKKDFLEHNQVLAYFHGNQITVFGTVIRVDHTADKLALCVKRSTDDGLWEKLCD